MEERRSDTEQTYGEESPPQGVSNQNAEEAPHEDGDAPEEQPPRSSDQNPGGAGEDSQATGHPDNAG